MPLVIYGPGGRHTHTHTHTHTHAYIHTEVILRNQACAWFKKWDAMFFMSIPIYTSVHLYVATYVSIECIELITATNEATNVITTITTAITHTTTNTTTATASSSVSVDTPTTVQITSSQNSTGNYVCI